MRCLIYQIPQNPGETKIEIKKSTFIASIFHTSTQQEMHRELETLRQNHPKANHHCWAHILGAPNDSQSFGFSDDGEPKNSAGKPILNVLSHSGFGETTIVVTRYFGGIKLGVGGLVKAYTQAAQEALLTVVAKEQIPTKTYTITVPYNMEPIISHFLNKAGYVVNDKVFDSNVTYLIDCPIPQYEILHQELCQILGIAP